MKRGIGLLIFWACLWMAARADHITGGEMYYTYGGQQNGEYKYHVTLKLFMRCNSGRQFADPTVVSIFNKSNNERVKDISVPLFRQETISLSDAGPCVTNPPQVCYVVGYYEFDISLPVSTDGYVLASMVNYRIEGINNLATNYGLIGALYSTDIPGNGQVTDGPANNSAAFTGSDLVVICASNSFTYSFAATDKDGDQLRYSFCDAYESTGGGGNGRGGNGAPPAAPPFPRVPYGAPDFSGNAPLGSNVQIDPSTGKISGIAPKAGVYVVTVCVDEIRNGKVIATQRKDLQINIADCSLAAASLIPEYMLCRNSKTLSVSNLSVSPLIQSSVWEVHDKNGTLLYSSGTTSLNYTFADTGTYSIKLVINRGQQCSDSSSSLVRVYPGFTPAFDANRICILNPTSFVDRTQSSYGIINSWYWDFGDPFNYSDTSSAQNPNYTYQSVGAKNIRLIVSNSRGCRDTVTQVLTIIDKPPLSLLFRDTLICIPDAVQLGASGPGSFSWSPSVAITGGNTGNPFVSPLQTTRYFVELDTGGCRSRDSVDVRVVDHVSLQLMNDSTICQGDTIRLHLTSDGFTYNWTPASQVDDATAARPLAVTTRPTVYQVSAHIGSCTANGQVLITPVPYPLVNAGPDTLICYNSPAFLHGYTDGMVYSWSPDSGLSDPASLDPVARPGQTTRYKLTAYDNKGCPKPGFDDILVSVLPPIRPSAGADTAVVVDQPLQLQASGGTSYFWKPAFGLSSPYIADPVARFGQPSEGLRYTVLVYNEAGCVDSASITIKVFQTRPSVFVPNAFTPNNDGHNDIIRPIAVGMQRIDYFIIYNRWGQQLFITHQNGQGWDGRIGGQLQPTGTYVWMVKAVDFTGKPYFQKGILELIR